MPNCQRCSKPVYFAERKTSLGKEWHRQCLSCEECGKVLHPGQHAEHKGKPYCHLPCYSARFGPHIKGYGVPTSGYNIYSDTGTMKNKIGSYRIGGVDKEEILYKLQRYNEYNAGRNSQLDWKEENGILIISGLLRLHWRINKQIQFKPKDDVPTTANLDKGFRKSFVMAMNNGRSLDPKELFHIYDDGPHESTATNPSTSRSASPSTSANDRTVVQRERISSNDDSIILRKRKSDIQRFHTVCYKGERAKSKRFSINGHFYDGETSIFTPAHGTVTTVHINSCNTTQEVIQALLDKFKVENRAEEFCLIEARRHGEMNRLLSTDYPLLERVLLGPEEDEAKIFIMESDSVAKAEGVNQYVSLPEAVLRGFLEKFHAEELQALERIRSRFARYREKLEIRLWEITSCEAGESET